MKLLNKTISLYILYASALLLIAMPILYFAIQNRVAEEVDESLAEQKDKIINRLQKTDTLNLSYWLQNTEPSITLIPLTKESNKPDKFYTIISFDKIAKEKSAYRILETNVNLQKKPYTLIIESSLLDSEDLIESIVKITALLLILIIVGLVLINQVLSKKLWKPFYSTINKLNDFKIEANENIQFDKTGIKEFTDLNNAITALTTRNKAVYQSQKEFTENASHEMQTPLAVLQGKLDLLMQTNPLSQEQSELITDLVDVNHRMNRLNKTLLLLSKIENNQFAEIEEISLKQVLEKLIEQYRFQAEQKNITITNNFINDIPITANRMLIEIMLGNFLSNAIKHNTLNGTIIITGSGSEICFKNTGVAYELDKDKIFQRFQKQTASNNSTGLGLPIATKIAALYHFRVQYKYTNALHQFTLILY